MFPRRFSFVFHRKRAADRSACRSHSGNTGALCRGAAERQSAARARERCLLEVIHRSHQRSVFFVDTCSNLPVCEFVASPIAHGTTNNALLLLLQPLLSAQGNCATGSGLKREVAASLSISLTAPTRVGVCLDRERCFVVVACSLAVPPSHRRDCPQWISLECSTGF